MQMKQQLEQRMEQHQTDLSAELWKLGPARRMERV
jgi:hypothetical protein